jgi:hypothetical protein
MTELIPYIINENGYWTVAYKKRTKGFPEITVSSKGVANGLSEDFNDGYDFGVDSYDPTSTATIPYTQTAGIQEGINYVGNKGEIKLTGGNFNITATGNTTINIPYNVSIDIHGINRASTIITAPFGFFSLLTGSEQNINPISISNMTLKTTEASTSTSGYFLLGSSSYGFSNIKIFNLDMYGGGNNGTGVFNLGSFASVQGGAPLKNVHLKNLYIDTEGNTDGNEAFTFPNIFGDDFIVNNLSTIGANNLGIGFFNMYGGVVIIENTSSFGYFNTKPYSSTASATTTDIYVRLIFRNCVLHNSWYSGDQSGFVPLDLIVENCSITNTNAPFTGAGETPTFHTILMNNITVGEEYCEIFTSMTALAIILNNITLFNNSNLNAFAQPLLNLCLPYESTTVTIIINNIFVGSMANQNSTLLAFATATSSIVPIYDITIKGSGVSTSYNFNGSTYSDPNGFINMVNANSSSFGTINYEYYNYTTGILYKFNTHNSATIPTNPPVTATVYQNTNPYDIKLSIPITYPTTASTATTAWIRVGTSSTAGDNPKVDEIAAPDTESTAGGRTITLKATVPAGQYFEVSESNATIGTAVVSAA